MPYPHCLDESCSHATVLESRNQVVCKTSVCTNSLTIFVVAWTISSVTMTLAMLHATSQWEMPSKGVLNNEYRHRSDAMSYFQTCLNSVYSIMMIAVVFGSIMVNPCRQHAFHDILLAHHLEWWSGMPLDTSFRHLLFALTSLWTVMLHFYCMKACGSTLYLNPAVSAR